MLYFYIIVTELTDMNGIVTNMDGMMIDMNDTNINNSNDVIERQHLHNYFNIVYVINMHYHFTTAEIDSRINDTAAEQIDVIFDVSLESSAPPPI